MHGATRSGIRPRPRVRHVRERIRLLPTRQAAIHVIGASASDKAAAAPHRTLSAPISFCVARHAPGPCCNGPCYNCFCCNGPAFAAWPCPLCPVRRRWADSCARLDNQRTLGWMDDRHPDTAARRHYSSPSSPPCCPGGCGPGLSRTVGQPRAQSARLPNMGAKQECLEDVLHRAGGNVICRHRATGCRRMEADAVEDSHRHHDGYCASASSIA